MVDIIWARREGHVLVTHLNLIIALDFMRVNVFKNVND